MKTPSVAKLPKWAQELIENLTRQRDLARTQRDEARDQYTGGIKTRTYIERSFGEPMQYIPDTRGVTFMMTDKSDISVGFEYEPGTGRSQSKTLIVCSTGGRRLRIVPHVANVISIEVEE